MGGSGERQVDVAELVRCLAGDGRNVLTYADGQVREALAMTKTSQRPGGLIVVVGAVLASFATINCTGSIRDPAGAPTGATAGQTPNPGSNPGSGTGGSGTGGSGTGSTPPPPGGAQPVATMHKLTASQYANSLRDLL